MIGFCYGALCTVQIGVLQVQLLPRLLSSTNILSISGCPGQDQRAARAGGVGRERARQPQHDLGRVLRREDRGVAQPAQPQQGPQEPRHDRHQGEEPQKS